jgi:hypothetical protein
MIVGINSAFVDGAVAVIIDTVTDFFGWNNFAFAHCPSTLLTCICALLARCYVEVYVRPARKTRYSSYLLIYDSVTIVIYSVTEFSMVRMHTDFVVITISCASCVGVTICVKVFVYDSVTVIVDPVACFGRGSDKLVTLEFEIVITTSEALSALSNVMLLPFCVDSFHFPVDNYARTRKGACLRNSDIITRTG